MKRFFVLGAALGWLAAHAGGISQHSACRDYVRCFEATGGVKGSLDSSYGPMGTCWTTTDFRYWECADECFDAHSARIAAFPDAGCKTPLKVERPRGCGL